MFKVTIYALAAIGAGQMLHQSIGMVSKHLAAKDPNGFAAILNRQTVASQIAVAAKMYPGTREEMYEDTETYLQAMDAYTL